MITVRYGLFKDLINYNGAAAGELLFKAFFDAEYHANRKIWVLIYLNAISFYYILFSNIPNVLSKNSFMLTSLAYFSSLTWFRAWLR